MRLTRNADGTWIGQFHNLKYVLCWVRPELLQLLSHLQFKRNSFPEWQTVTVPPDNPYGKGMIVEDMRKILGASYSAKYLQQLHRETMMALEVCCEAQQFHAGFYFKQAVTRWQPLDTVDLYSTLYQWLAKCCGYIRLFDDKEKNIHYEREAI